MTIYRWIDARFIVYSAELNLSKYDKKQFKDNFTCKYK